MSVPPIKGNGQEELDLPTYEYECEKCGAAFQKFQNMSEAPLKECPDCGGQVKRLFGTGAGIIFKAGAGAASQAPSCGRDTPCCGRSTPCDTRPCD